MGRRETPIAQELRSSDLNLINRAFDRIGGDNSREFSRKLASDNLAAILDFALSDDFDVTGDPDFSPAAKTFDRAILVIAKLGDRGLDALSSEILNPDSERLFEALYFVSTMFDRLVPAIEPEDSDMPTYCETRHKAGQPLSAPYPEVQFSTESLDQLRKAIIGAGKGAYIRPDENIIPDALDSLDLYRRVSPFLAGA